MCNYLIPNIFHFININELLEDNIPIYKYYSIKSIIQLNKPELIYFHTNHEYKDDLWNELKNSCNFIILRVNYDNNYNEELFNDILKNKLIYKILYEYGGIYFEIGSLCIQPLTNFRLYNFFKNNNDKVIGSEKKSYMVFKYLHSTTYNIKNLNNKFGEININNIIIKNHLIDEKLYMEVFRNNLDNIIYNEIYNYSFSKYFNIINEAYFVLFEDISYFKKYEKIYIHKITIYNLLIRYILTYHLNQNSIEIKQMNEIYDISPYKDKFLLINNIDKIIWINLDKSVYRKENMDHILKNIHVQNERFSALDGSVIENIHEKYFYCINNEIYPNFSNKEYAILATHLNVIKKCCNYDNTNDNIYLIMEDDISLDFIKYWNKDISTIINECSDDWEIIMLSYFSLNINYKKLYNEWNNEWSGAAYLLNTKKVRNKIELLQKKNNENNENKKNNENNENNKDNENNKNNENNNDFKWICNKDDLMVSDNYIFSKFKTYVYKYPYFTFPNNNDSTLHDDHINYHKLYKLCNYMVLENMDFNNL